MGARRGSGLIPIVAAATSTTLWQTQTGRRAVVKKIMWLNRSGGNAFLDIGFTSQSGTFVPVLPRIFMVNGIDGELSEDLIPVAGNTPDGFLADSIVGATGNPTGNIIARASAAGATPADVQVAIELDENEGYDPQQA